MAKKRGLGRGLEALLSDITSMASATQHLIEGDLQKIDLDKIQKGKYQPRREIEPEALEELANSIRSQGVIQPIIVRSIETGLFEIVAGERRWRAARLAGLTTIPALVRELPDEATVAVALIENIQRQDLNPIEEAAALERLITEFSLTHEQVANSVGRSRTTVTNLLRLLSLHPKVRIMLEKGQLEMGHARALLAIQGEEQLDAAHTIINRDMSVRETENYIRNLKAPVQPKKVPSTVSPSLQAYQHELSNKFHTKVQLQESLKGNGKIVIQYKNPKELKRILDELM